MMIRTPLLTAHKTMGRKALASGVAGLKRLPLMAEIFLKYQNLDTIQATIHIGTRGRS